jgi:tetratricopeptide (TPR) repeat protein
MRRYVIVAATAVVAAGATVGITLATRTTPPAATTQPGRPPLALDLGVRVDREAADLRRAESLYDANRVADAATIFDRYRSLEAQVGRAFAAWPHGFSAVRALAAEHPGSSLVELHYGLALFWRGHLPEAQDAWRAARTSQPDTSYAVKASDLLFPGFPRGLPDFIPSFPSPPALDHLSPPQQLAYLARHAARGGAREKLLYGVALQRLGRPVSARREFDAAVRLARTDPEPRVAAAVARFDKAHPEAAFSRLGPLAKQFPQSASVRFHLGLLLLWLGEVQQAKRELRLAQASQSSPLLASEARRFLERLAEVGSNRGSR